MSLFDRFRLAVAKAVAPRPARRPWTESGVWTTIHDPFPGAWQQGHDVSTETIERFSAVYACVNLIASDIAKLRPRIIRFEQGVWVEDVAARRPVIRKPNRYQTHIQFYKYWMCSKLYHGNAYVLLERDERGAVARMYILDSRIVEPMVTPDGGVYYRVRADWLVGLAGEAEIYIPASEIIHDRGLCPYHPLLGVSPLFACASSAALGSKIVSSGTKFFANAARPSGVLTAPGTIADETAARLRRDWDEKFTGENAGRVAILGDGLRYDQMTMSAVDAQQLEQLNGSIVDVARAFGVAPHKIGAGPPPTFNNIAALNQDYYSQTLQTHIEDIEALMDQALGFEPNQGFEFDLEGLLRMDPSGRATVAKEYVGAGIWAPNEARATDGKLPVKGGESPVMQQQNWPLETLANRPPPWQEPAPEPVIEDQAKALIRRIKRKAAAMEARK